MPPLTRQGGWGPHSLLAVNLLLWGYNWVPMYLMLEDAGPMTTAAIRVAGGALSLFILLLAMGRPIAPPDDRRFIWVGLIQVGGMAGLSALALVYGDVGRSAILLFTMPFWTMVLAKFSFNERVATKQWVALAIALTGVGAIAFQSLGNVGALTGAACAVGAGLAWAVGNTIARRGGNTDLLHRVAWEQAIGTLPLIAIATIVHEREPHLTTQFAMAATFSAVLGSGIGWLLWNASVKAFAPTTLALASLSIPVIATIAAFLQLNERPNQVTLTGLTIILAALVLASYPQRAVPQRGR